MTELPEVKGSITSHSWCWCCNKRWKYNYNLNHISNLYIYPVLFTCLNNTLSVVNDKSVQCFKIEFVKGLKCYILDPCNRSAHDADTFWFYESSIYVKSRKIDFFTVS